MTRGMSAGIMRSTMRPLRIAFNHTRLDTMGGVEGYIHKLLGFLLDRGHTVDFFGGKFPLEMQHPGLKLIHVPYLRSPRPLRLASFAWLSHRAIAREERKRPYDVIQGFSRTYYHTLYRDGSGCRADYCALYLDKFARRGLRSIYYRLNPVDWIVRRIERKRYVERPQRLVIAISGFVRDQILRRYPVAPETVRVLYSGVDCHRFHPGLRPEGRARLRALFRPRGAPPDSESRALSGAPPAASSGAEPNDRVLLFVGNDYHRKGLDLILECLGRRRSQAHGQSWPFRLVVVGGDSHAEGYARKADVLGLKERVRFLGKRRDVPELMAGADVLLLPSYFDAYANVSSEALACGTPVVASATSGAAEIVRRGCGWVLERTDLGELDRCLEAFFDQADLEPLRRAARAQALEVSWDRHYQEIEAIYEELASTREPTREV